MDSKTTRVRKHCTPIAFSEDDREFFEKECSKVLMETKERWVTIEDLGDQILQTIRYEYYLIGDCGLWELYKYVKPENKATT